MSGAESALLFLLVGVFGVLVVILVVLGSISRSLLRLERRMDQQEGVAAVQTPVVPGADSLPKSMQKADFMAFLNEEPHRRQLPKQEQFAAYRKWRKEKGLNWPKLTGNQTPIR